MLQIYKASAGSGKTFKLTREYIKYLIADKQEDGTYRLKRNFNKVHSHILAITFTNKATNEMTARIIKDLARLADMVARDEEKSGEAVHGVEATMKSQHADYFIKELSCTPEQLRHACREALTNVLCDFSYFNVSTIDAFFQSVLRIFTREVDIPDNFNIELNNEFAITLGIDELFNSLDYHTISGTPEDVERRWINDWLFQFMQENMQRGGAFNMFSRGSRLYGELIRAFRNIMNEDFKRLVPQLREYFSDRTRIVKFVSSLKKVYDHKRDNLRLGIESFISSYPETGVVNSNFKKALEGIVAKPYIEKLSTTIETVLSSKGTKAFTQTGIKKLKLDETDFGNACEIAMHYKQLFLYYTDFNNIRRNIYTFGLLSVIMNSLDTYCRENNLVLLSETNNILKGIINDDETPFLYEKLGYYLDHFLIDEFQDTSPMQWENMRPLVMESLSRNNDDLIIGDEKQCIYRFRNSDPLLLGETVGNDAIKRFRRDDIIDIQGVKLSENNNWRSSPEIVRFNNSLFLALAQIVDNRSASTGHRLSAVATYGNIVQQIDPKRDTLPGYVNIQFAPESASSDNPETDDESTAELKPSERALENMVAHMRRQLEAGYRPGDIAVLVRSHTDGEKVISYLFECMNRAVDPLPRFDIISNDAMGLNSCGSIRLIISVLRLVNLPEFMEVDYKAAARSTGTPDPEVTMSDAYRRARLVNRFQFYMHLTHDASGRPYTPAEALEAALRDNSNAGNEPMHDTTVTDMRSLLDMKCLNLPAVVERIIDRFVPESAKVTDNIFLTSFVDLVIEFSQRGNHDISSFLNWWDKVGCRNNIISPADKSALTIITIHQAKGLEYPCVHIPFANSPLFKGDSISWFELDKSEFRSMEIPDDEIPPALPLTLSTSMSESPLFSERFADIMASMRIDELNVFYVAFTRPTRELIVYSSPTKNKNEGFMNYMKQAIALMTPEQIASDFASAGSWVEPLASYMDGDSLIIGEPTVPKNKQEEIEDVKPNPYAPRRLDVKKYTTTPEAERAHACTEPEALDPFDINDSRQLGNFLHAVMSLITDPSRLDYAFRRQCYRYRIDDSTARILRKRIENAMADPRAYRWFNGFSKVITERTISSRGDFRRPDRIVWLPDGTIEVVDFKFVDDIAPDLLQSRKHAGYVKQIDGYCNTIKGSTHMPVSGYIWYISHEETIPVKIV